MADKPILTDDDLRERWGLEKLEQVHAIVRQGDLPAIDFNDLLATGATPTGRKRAKTGPKVYRFRLADVEFFEQTQAQPRPGAEAIRAVEHARQERLRAINAELDRQARLGASRPPSSNAERLKAKLRKKG